MPNSVKAKLKKLWWKHKIDINEYRELCAKLDGHDAQIRVDERAKVLEEIKEIIATKTNALYWIEQMVSNK